MMFGNWFGGNCLGNNLGNGQFGSFGTGMMAFSWLTSILAIVLLCLGIAALWKYVNKK